MKDLNIQQNRDVFGEFQDTKSQQEEFEKVIERKISMAKEEQRNHAKQLERAERRLLAYVHMLEEYKRSVEEGEPARVDSIRIELFNESELNLINIPNEEV